MEVAIIQQKIHEIRGQKVMLDFDLSILYEVPTKVLNQAVKRNIERFPADFMFQLTRDEYNSLRSQIVTLESKGAHSKYNSYALRSVKPLKVIVSSW
ncbi:MAG TPA: ORF6N domain-containing protein [Puia sp.]|nr:ORF6N domain-containing protein [Puia sp.]